MSLKLGIMVSLLSLGLVLFSSMLIMVFALQISQPKSLVLVDSLLPPLEIEIPQGRFETVVTKNMSPKIIICFSYGKRCRSVSDDVFYKLEDYFGFWAMDSVCKNRNFKTVCDIDPLLRQLGIYEA